MPQNDLFAPPTKDELAQHSAPAVTKDDIFSPPSKEELEQHSGPQYGKGQTALEHFGNALTFGYLPQLQSMAEKPMTATLNKVTGKDVEAEDYVTARDKNAERLRLESEQNPKTAVGSELAGGAVQAAVTPLPEAFIGKSLLGGAAKGAAIGAAQGALSNPGEAKGEIDPLQAGDRIENAMQGAKYGGVFGGAGGLLHGLVNAKSGAQEFANSKAIKASGGMLKDFRELLSQNVGSGEEKASKLQDLGKYALDKGIVKAGDDYESVATKAEAARVDAGNRLETVYNQAKEQVGKGRTGAFETTGFDPSRDKKAVLDEVSKAMGHSPDKSSAINRISTYLDSLAEDYKDKTLSPKTQQEIKTALDEEINYSRNPLTKQPGMEKAYSAMRKFVSGKIDEDINAIGTATDNPELLKSLKDANKDYGYSKKLRDMATDRVNRENANRQIGLTDTIAGGAGAEVGAHVAGAPGAFVGGAIGAVGNKLSRRYGPAVQAGAANRFANSPLARTLESAGTPLTNLQSVSPGLLQRSLIEQQLQDKREKR